MLSPRRRHSRWRMFPVLLMFVGLIHRSELAPPGATESSFSTFAARKKPQSLGSLNDFPWQTWLLVDTPNTAQQPEMNSATLLRRITPKSVFIAPALPECAEGYRADNMNRCVKSVSIDETAHFNFLLQRLNALYANQETASAKNKQKQPTGPLQLNIPLVPSNANSQSTKIENAEALPMNDPIAAMADESLSDDGDDEDGGNVDDKTRSRETVTVYKRNDTKSDNEDSRCSLKHSDVGDVNRADEKSDAIVPVVEFVDETNDTSFSEVVDYKIPIDFKILLNASDTKRFDESDVRVQDAPVTMTTSTTTATVTTDERNNFTEQSPIMMLLLSPTKLSSTAASPETDNPPLSARNGTAENATMQVLNITWNATAQEITGFGVSSPNEEEEEEEEEEVEETTTTSPTWKLPESPSIGKDRGNETQRAEDAGSATESSAKASESRADETEFAYDEEVEEDDDEYPYGTDVPDEESAEGEEILKHGEAGITIPAQNRERLHRDQQQRNRTADEAKASDARDRVEIRFNETTPADNDEAGSNISSEVSIDGDLILETTLLDVNTERLQAITKSPRETIHEVVTTSNGNNDDDDDDDEDNDNSGESFDEDRSTAPEVVLAPQDSRGATSAGSHGRKSEQLAKVGTRENENERRAEPEAAPSLSESLLYPPEEDLITEIRAVEEDRPNVGGNAMEASPKDTDSPSRIFAGSDVTANSFERASTSLNGPVDDYVRFPDRTRQPQGYVRFPSSEANSIHSQNYKQRYSVDDGPYGSTSTKSSVPVRQKPSVYHLTSSWKQLEHTAATLTTQRQKQQQQQQQHPSLLRFWSKMPLVRDPAIYPVRRSPTNRSNDSHDELSRDQFRRSSPSRDPRARTSPEDGDARKRRRTPNHR